MGKLFVDVDVEIHLERGSTGPPEERIFDMRNLVRARVSERESESRRCGKTDAGSRTCTAPSGGETSLERSREACKLMLQCASSFQRISDSTRSLKNHQKLESAQKSTLINSLTSSVLLKTFPQSNQTHDRFAALHRPCNI